MIEEKKTRYGPRHRTLERLISLILAREGPVDTGGVVMIGKPEHGD